MLSRKVWYTADLQILNECKRQNQEMLSPEISVAVLYGTCSVNPLVRMVEQYFLIHKAGNKG